MSFKSVALERHNYHRGNHKAPALTWDSRCESHAKRFANELLRTNGFQHSKDRDDMGENLWAWQMTRGALNKTDEQMAKEAVDAWYNEIKKYSYMRPRFSKKTGHFTQLVWVETKTVGMAIAKNNTRAVVVANYTPQGNVQTQFKKNVKRKKRGCTIM